MQPHSAHGFMVGFRGVLDDFVGERNKRDKAQSDSAPFYGNGLLSALNPRSILCTR